MGSDTISVEQYNEVCERAEKADAEVARLRAAIAEKNKVLTMAWEATESVMYLLKRALEAK